MITISIGASCADGKGNLLRGQVLVSLYLPPFNPKNKTTGLLVSSGRRRRDKGVAIPRGKFHLQDKWKKPPGLTACF